MRRSSYVTVLLLALEPSAKDTSVYSVMGTLLTLSCCQSDSHIVAIVAPVSFRTGQVMIGPSSLPPNLAGRRSCALSMCPMRDPSGRYWAGYLAASRTGTYCGCTGPWMERAAGLIVPSDILVCLAERYRCRWMLFRDKLCESSLLRHGVSALHIRMESRLKIHMYYPRTKEQQCVMCEKKRA